MFDKNGNYINSYGKEVNIRGLENSQINLSKYEELSNYLMIILSNNNNFNRFNWGNNEKY